MATCEEKMSPFLRSIIPNTVTVTRGLLGPTICAIILYTDHTWFAFWLFITAILTDLVDGILARMLNATSKLGTFLDALADKFLTDPIWAVMWYLGWAPWWLAAPMLLRDFAIAILWYVDARHDQQAKPTLMGQLMVSFEGISLGVLLVRTPFCDVHWPTVGVAIGLISLGFAIASSIEYAKNRRQH
jgi:cardiolipin synthase (CMP-forming)